MSKFILFFLLFSLSNLQNAKAEITGQIEFQPWVVSFDDVCKNGKIIDVDSSTIIVKSCTISNLKVGSVLASFNLRKTFKVASFSKSNDEIKIKYTEANMNDIYKKMEFSGKTDGKDLKFIPNPDLENK